MLFTASVNTYLLIANPFCLDECLTTHMVISTFRGGGGGRRGLAYRYERLRNSDVMDDEVW